MNGALSSDETVFEDVLSDSSGTVRLYDYTVKYNERE